MLPAERTLVARPLSKFVEGYRWAPAIMLARSWLRDGELDAPVCLADVEVDCDPVLTHGLRAAAHAAFSALTDGRPVVLVTPRP